MKQTAREEFHQLATKLGETCMLRYIEFFNSVDMAADLTALISFKEEDVSQSRLRTPSKSLPSKVSIGIIFISCS